MVSSTASKKEHIIILGAGLVGSLMSIYLANRGYAVSVFEKRGDLRQYKGGEGRSINLALSNRGWKALQGVGIMDEIEAISIFMEGRTMHDQKGQLSFLPYGKEGEGIYSVSREALNNELTTFSENKGTRFYFNQLCTEVDLEKIEIKVEEVATKEVMVVKADLIIGADGAFSTLRKAIQQYSNISFSQNFIEHGYKELTIPPTPQNEFALKENALHIWPRRQFMLIALPNPDKTFTCTLFFPLKGEISFESLDTNEKVYQFFKETFPDVMPLMPDFLNNYFKNPTSSLVTINCFPWSVKGKAVLIGDAAHGILPFFGQGMNSGFEDCRIFDALIGDHEGKWDIILEEFQNIRKPNTDAIGELALQNFVEMRDLVADPKFLLRKKIEARLHQMFPLEWIPLYSMVTFSDMPYSSAKALGAIQESTMDKVMEIPDIEDNWENLDYQGIINEFGQLKNQHAASILSKA
ncbi:MAG: FAD-dependent monooxygenase [Bacteroidota bacterium]|nr:FAD-dependent monooxygenase [Bacteroidota bacterium]